MSLLATTNPTLVDLAKRLDPDGKVALIAEMLNQTNEILLDMPWIEANGPTSHRTTVRTGIPAPTWRKIYQGVQPVKSATAQVTEGMGMLEAYGEVDKALADLNGNTAEFRLSEDKAIIEGISQEVAKTIMYGNEGTKPESFTGLAPRLGKKTGSASSDNVIDAGGSSTGCTSIWLVGWGENSVHGIYPKGSKAGLSIEDKGQVTLETAPDGSAGRMEAYRTHYRWDCGLSVRDWRYVVRIANIKISSLTKDAATGADLLDLIAQATELLPNGSRPAFYCSRSIKSWIRRQQKNSKNVLITMDQVAGQPVTMIDGIPVRRVDAISNNETAIS
jgi:hypothetical protein